jgi:type VI secretion system protein ImpJ
VKHFQPEEGNVAFGSMNGNRAASAQEYRRFRVDEVPTPDLFLKSPQRPDLQYLLYEVRVFFEGDPAVGYECVRVAELAIDDRGQCTGLSPDFIFPCVSVGASRELGDLLSGIRNILEAKARLLWERAQEYGLSTLDPLTLGTMQAINRYTALFQHYLEVPETHPYVFYGLLRQCVSELSTFFEASPLLGGTFPPYRHEDLRESFRRLVAAVRQLLERLSKGPETMVPLHYDAGLKLFTADLNAMFTDRQYRHFLAVKTDMPLGDLDRFLMRTGKICSREDVDELKRRNLPGLSVRYQETIPEGLAPRTGFRYFELLLHDRDNIWSKIEQRRNIAVACQLTSQDAEMQLWVLTRP